MSEEILTADANLAALARQRDEQAQREYEFEQERRRWQAQREYEFEQERRRWQAAVKARELRIMELEQELSAAQALIAGYRRAQEAKIQTLICVEEKKA